ncbi:MAG: serine/threonine-protein kinase [Planctomycetota bacterium]
MTDERRRAAREVFLEVIELEGDEREESLARACSGDAALRAEVEALLDAGAGAGAFLGSPTQEVPGASVASPTPEAAGSSIGPYKLLEQIGEGGMGTIWMAEQREPIQRRVALKVIKLGMDTKQVIARFEAERQALALMDHAHIAKVFDAGTTDAGRPYFVMEYIRGIPILEYCDREKVDTAGRLQLFTDVCHAIQHAHQKGIIHRDIKPSNVLVTLHDGVPVPKVIDFGIAKATNQELTQKTLFTEHRQMIGTPAYMSPEQAEMSGLDIDTRSDVYALGVLLYELLTGTTPFDIQELLSQGFGEMMRVIREVEPHKPSTRISSLGDTASQTAARRCIDAKQLGTLLRGDLDWIIMKCLEKDRTRRYETASGLAADVQRHLDDEPVLASPPSTAYRVRKFVRRNRGRVVAGVALAAVLVLGLVGTTLGFLAAREQSTLAEERADDLQLVADFQSERLGSIVPERMGSSLRESIVAAAPKEDRAALEARLGRINFTNIGLESLRENVFGPALLSIEEQFADQPLIEAQLLEAMADTMVELGLASAAVAPQERVLAIRRAELGELDARTIESRRNRGAIARQLGDLDEAERILRAVWEDARRALGEEAPETLNARNSLGVLLEHRQNYAEAEVCFREVLAAYQRSSGPDARTTLNAQANLGHVVERQGRIDEAAEITLEVLERRRRAFGDDDADTLLSMGMMTAIHAARGEEEETLALERQVFQGRSRVLGDDHPHTLHARGCLGSSLRNQGHLDEAEPHLVLSLEGQIRALGPDHDFTIQAYVSLAELREAQARYRDAAPLFCRGLTGRRRLYGIDHPLTTRTVQDLGRVLRVLLGFEQAESILRDLIAAQDGLAGDDDLASALPRAALAGLLLERGSFEEAERVFRRALPVLRRDLSPEDPSASVTMLDLASALTATGRGLEAESMLSEAIDVLTSQFDADHWLCAEARSRLGATLTELGRYDEAEPLLVESYDLLEELVRYDEVHPFLVDGYTLLVANAPDDRAGSVLARTATRLAQLYEAWGRDAEAATWRSHAEGR